MRIKLDQNLPSELVEILRKLGHDVEDVYAEGLGGSLATEDVSSWQGCFIVISDSKVRVRRP
jgi:predicted nuclease of predicted toxin-antitoxin system